MKITTKGYEVLCRNCFVVSRHFSKDDRWLFAQHFANVLHLSFDNFDTSKFREEFRKQEA